MVYYSDYIFHYNVVMWVCARFRAVESLLLYKGCRGAGSLISIITGELGLVMYIE